MSYLLANMEATRIISDELLLEAKIAYQNRQRGGADAPTLDAMGRAFGRAAVRMDRQIRAESMGGEGTNA